MLSLITLALKVSLIGLWGAALLGFTSMSPLPEQYHLYVLALTGVVLLAHFIEYFAMKGKVLSKAKIEMSFTQTMLWGFGYWLPLLNSK
jgi:uncharacterized protein YhhL (DUF1145 family)